MSGARCSSAHALGRGSSSNRRSRQPPRRARHARWRTASCHRRRSREAETNVQATSPRHTATFPFGALRTGWRQRRPVEARTTDGVGGRAPSVCPNAVGLVCPHHCTLLRFDGSRSAHALPWPPACSCSRARASSDWCVIVALACKSVCECSVSALRPSVSAGSSSTS